jgi:chloride channel 3/4/5
VAVACGVISSSVTMLSKTKLLGAMDTDDSKFDQTNGAPRPSKSIYMAAGAGVPEIKTILSGFVIPKFLGVKVLCLKVFGAIFAVASGLPLGKEAPLIHIGAIVANLVGEMFPKYAHNGKQLREVITAGSAAGISAAFGAPIGGVLFAYEASQSICQQPSDSLGTERIFSSKSVVQDLFVLHGSCHYTKVFNPTGTGRLVLFETHYGTSYTAIHYLVFVLIGIVGGIWGGTFTRANQLWARWFRRFPIIKEHPIFEVFIVVVIVSTVQFVDPATRARYDVVIRNLLVDCETTSSSGSWVCTGEGDFQRHTSSGSFTEP